MNKEFLDSLLDAFQEFSGLAPDQVQQIKSIHEDVYIEADIELLINMGFDRKMIKKVYLLLRPENIEKAIEYMTEINGVYQHNFFEGNNPDEKNLCSICNKLRQNHLDNDKDIIINDDIQDIKINDDLVISEDKCNICEEMLKNEDKEENKLQCGHLFCSNCYFDYLKSLISEGKVEEIKCMNYKCKQKLSEEFIILHISNDRNLVNKYIKFKKKVDILNDEDKKICPYPDCDSFLPRSQLSKYVQCENGHIYCFNCLNPPHDVKPCYYKIETPVRDWSKNLKLKRCPKCQIIIQKIKGCNRMVCPNCQYIFCWLCKNKCNYNHYKSGNCQGKDFNEEDDLKPKDLETNQNYFGIHKIFKCIYKYVDKPISISNNYCSNFCRIFTFWILGFILFSASPFINYGINPKEMKFNKQCTYKAIGCCILGFILSLFISFQFTFSCCLAPFILIAFIYPKFFQRIELFLGIGENSDTIDRINLDEPMKK